jgi:hypothetical protein
MRADAALSPPCGIALAPSDHIPFKNSSILSNAGSMVSSGTREIRAVRLVVTKVRPHAVKAIAHEVSRREVLVPVLLDAILRPLQSGERWVLRRHGSADGERYMCLPEVWQVWNPGYPF